MAPRKKKTAPKIPYDDVSQARRSSLQVNLSYVSNVSDSGNETFRSTQAETDPTVPDGSRISAQRSVSPKVASKQRSAASPLNPVLQRMSEKETALGESCQRLKEAIMHKTRQIFDDGTELAEKTETILKRQRQALKEINNDTKVPGTHRNIDSINLIKSPMKNRSLRQASVMKSPGALNSSSRTSKAKKSILNAYGDKSGNESLKKSKKVLTINLTRIADPRLEMSMESNISDIGAPITCSSFIAGHENLDNPLSQNTERNPAGSSGNSGHEESTRRTEASSFSPEQITAVPNRFFTSEKKNSSRSSRRSDVSKIQEKSLVTSNCDDVIPMELTNVQSHIPLCQSSSSNGTARTSLNVNTSISSLSGRSEIGRSKNCENNVSRNDRDAEVSLHVNTSLEEEDRESIKNDNSSNKNDYSDGNESGSETDDEKLMTKNVENRGKVIRDSDSDAMENISLMARLRNSSSKKLHSGNRASFEGPSFVEGTPYPPSRSILWRTQIRSETIRQKKNQESTGKKFADSLTKNSSKLSDSGSSKSSDEYTTAPNDTIILGDSPSRIKCNTKSPRVIKDSSIEENPDKAPGMSATIPNESITPSVSKGRRKKLLPLRDNFEIFSFSPISPNQSSQKKPISWKPRKHFRRRKSVRATAAKRIEALTRENEDEDDEPACSNVGTVKTQKTMTKVRKSRRVISKKIVVKKTVANELMESIGRRNSGHSNSNERNSMHVFLEKKRFSVADRTSKSQKLVIVATGFSKGDVDLVKTVVKELGGAEINPTVTRRTTHVVSTGVRTINLLRGIIRGCWMVSLDWVLKSLEEKRWLNAERYELVHFSKAVRENRTDRQIFGKAYVPELFTTCGPIHVGHGTSPPSDILKELIKTAGGQIADNPRDARLSVGSNGLREIWVLDSITTGDLQPVEEYKRKSLKD